MKREHLGYAIVAIGIVALLNRGGAGGLLAELVKLGGLGLFGTLLWRFLEPRTKPAARLVVLGVLALVATVSLDLLAGGAFLAFGALGFWLHYSTPRRGSAPWALIPAGVLATLALVATISSVFPRWNSGAFFTLGMTAVFTIVYLLPKERGGGRWALWPAIAWGFITLIANDPGGMPAWLVPLLLIGGGVVLLGWTRRGKS